MKRKVAVVSSTSTYSDYNEEYRTLSSAITEWLEVDEEEYAALTIYTYRNRGGKGNMYASIIELKPIEEVKLGIQEMIEEGRKEKLKKDKAAAARKLSEKERKIKQDAKKRQLLIQKAKRLGLTVQADPTFSVSDCDMDCDCDH